MKWILGVDATRTAGGAVEFADLLARDGEDERVSPIHVIESLEGVLASPDSESFRTWSNASAAETLGERGWGAIRTVEAISPEEGLVHALNGTGAEAFIIGRRASRDGRHLIRLGRVARRMARHLPAPVVVVPRDYANERRPRGPIVFATDLSQASSTAAEFAMQLAKSMGLGLVVVHCVQGPAAVGAFLPGPVWAETHRLLHRTASADLDNWWEAHGHGDAELRVLDGSPVIGVHQVSNETDATMIVVGSRRLGKVDRLFSSSTGTELAATARVPVALVPPREQTTAPGASH